MDGREERKINEIQEVDDGVGHVPSKQKATIDPLFFLPFDVFLSQDLVARWSAYSNRTAAGMAVCNIIHIYV